VNTVRSFLALPLLVRWMLVGGLGPTVLLFALVLVGAFTEGLDTTVQSLGYVPAVFVVLGVPGALVGLVLGLVDRWSFRRVQARRGVRGAVALATVILAVPLTLFMVVPIAFGVALLQVSLPTGIGTVAAVVVGAVLASLPALGCLVRYRRVAAVASTLTGSVDADR